MLILLGFVSSFSTEAQKKVMNLSGMAPGKDGQRVNFFRYTESSTNQLGSDTVRDGKFHISVNVDEISPAVIQVGTTFGGTVILEPASVKYLLFEDGSVWIDGGKYNQILNGFLRDKVYKNADSLLRKLTNGGDFASAKGTPNEWEVVQLFLKREDARTNYLAALLTTHRDPWVKGIAAIMSELQPDPEKAMKIIESAAPKLGENSIVLRRVRSIHKQQLATMARRKSSMLGAQFTDFSAEDLQGNSVQLDPIVKSNRYTLLQFWASWCGPCRKEIPMLKDLYKSYESKGLAIVSFSMDDSRSNWEKASTIENIPWPNISDLKAFSSPVAKLYPIMGIPANVIIDSSGKIVASNLIGKELEEKIQTLL